MGLPLSLAGLSASTWMTVHGRNVAIPADGSGTSSPLKTPSTNQIGRRVFSRWTCCALRSNREISREWSMVI